MNVEETLVNLIRAGEEDERIGKFLRSVVQLEDFHRHSLINGMVLEMTLKGAPADFVHAIAALRDPGVVQALRQWYHTEA